MTENAELNRLLLGVSIRHTKALFAVHRALLTIRMIDGPARDIELETAISQLQECIDAALQEIETAINISYQK